MPSERTKPRRRKRAPTRDGLPVVAPLAAREWSVSCPVNAPDRRLHDQLIVSVGYPAPGREGNGVMSLRIGNSCVMLDKPGRRALRQLFGVLDHHNA